MCSAEGCAKRQRKRAAVKAWRRTQRRRNILRHIWKRATVNIPWPAPLSLCVTLRSAAPARTGTPALPATARVARTCGRTWSRRFVLRRHWRSVRVRYLWLTRGIVLLVLCHRAASVSESFADETARLNLQGLARELQDPCGSFRTKASGCQSADGAPSVRACPLVLGGVRIVRLWSTRSNETPPFGRSTPTPAQHQQGCVA